MGNNGQWDKESFTATPNYYYHYVILIEISGFAAQIVNASCYPLSILLIHKVFPLLPEQHLDGHQLWRNQEASI